MKTLATRVGRLLVVCLLTLSPTEARAAQGGAVIEELKGVLKTWDEAYMQRDTATLDRILAPDYVLIDASGTLLSRAEYLSSTVKSPEFSRVDSYLSEDVQVRVYGDAAVVTGVSPVKGRSRGRSQAFSGRYRFTDIWVKAPDGWKAVTTQSTRVGPDRP